MTVLFISLDDFFLWSRKQVRERCVFAILLFGIKYGNSTRSFLSDDKKRARIWDPSPDVEVCAVEVACGSLILSIWCFSCCTWCNRIIGSGVGIERLNAGRLKP
jgi:hypothetical protein